MSNGQHRRAPRSVPRLAVAAVAALTVTVVLQPAIGSADPGGSGVQPVADHRSMTVTEAEHQLTLLDRQGEIASEAYNTARVHMQQAHDRLTGLQADVRRQQARVTALRDQLVASALSDYQDSGGLSTSASFLVSTKPSQFIDALATTAVVQHQQAGMLVRLQQQRNALTAQQQQAARALAAVRADQRAAARHKATLDDKIAATRHLLANLKAEQRRRLLALQRQQSQTTVAQPTRGDVRPPAATPTQPAQTQAQPPAPPASGRAAIAVQTALAQVGKPYVYGAAGPDAFDCSGLTMYAWAAAGVALSHSSSVQSGQGVPVSVSALEPGDLVFYYSPVSHVAMYIGNGMVVHAPHPGASVEVVPMNSMPIAWARRVG